MRYYVSTPNISPELLPECAVYCLHSILLNKTVSHLLFSLFCYNYYTRQQITQASEELYYFFTWILYQLPKENFISFGITFSLESTTF